MGWFLLYISSSEGSDDRSGVLYMLLAFLFLNLENVFPQVKYQMVVQEYSTQVACWLGSGNIFPQVRYQMVAQKYFIFF